MSAAGLPTSWPLDATEIFATTLVNKGLRLGDVSSLSGVELPADRFHTRNQRLRSCRGEIPHLRSVPW